MKTSINKLAAFAIFAFILLAGNVRAEGNDATASSHETTLENSLQMENWMTDESIWNINTGTSVETEFEAGLEIENWMMDKSTWEIKNQEVETETRLQLEDWMMNKQVWNI